ncbi:hypothetical protein HDU91_005488 [Kappamyces sp. JEL0680]|nr:hypothetical protein HDU91_005488 [Kappamyces sp. JEL0680]
MSHDTTNGPKRLPTPIRLADLSLDAAEVADVSCQPSSRNTKAKRTSRKNLPVADTVPEPADFQDGQNAATDVTATWSTHGKVGARMSAIRKAKLKTKYADQAISSALEDGFEGITGQCQQSRFHADTLETLDRNVDLKGVTVLVKHVTVLQDAELFEGVKYGLVGRNGVGKSTLFKAIGWGLLIGWPKNRNVVYVEQLNAVDPQSRVLDVVLNADQKVVEAQKEVQILNAALESDNAKEMVQTLRSVRLQRLERDLFLQNQVAIKTSGARGASARTDLLVLEVQVAQARDTLSAPVSKAEKEEVHQNITALLQDLHHLLEVRDADSAEARVKKILIGLGFSESWILGPISQLSGGWRIRVSLAQALFLEPDILLLDEPTNALDLAAIYWLQNYLKGLENTTLVLVSHDRAFLNEVVDEIIVMKDQSLTYHVGNYEEYRENLENKRKNLQKQAEALDKKRAHIENSIQQGLKQAKEKGDDKKLSQVASRKKKLQERFGVERSASGHRFRLNQDMVGYFTGNRAEVEIDKDEAPIKWKFPTAEPLRVLGSMVQVEDVSFSFSKSLVLRNVTLNVEQGDRIGIVGANGEGKTTLIKLIMGVLTPTKGTVTRLAQARFGYLSQSLVEDIFHQPAELTTLEYIRLQLPNEPEKAIRNHFGGLGIGSQMMQPLSSLSGGQAVRLATGMITYSSPHVLVLDEPTNHLDMDTISAVIQAIQTFEGTVVVVSHDRHFIQSCCQKIYLVRKQRLKFLEGGMEEYISLLGLNSTQI